MADAVTVTGRLPPVMCILSDCLSRLEEQQLVVVQVLVISHMLRLEFACVSSFRWQGIVYPFVSRRSRSEASRLLADFQVDHAQSAWIDNQVLWHPGTCQLW